MEDPISNFLKSRFRVALERLRKAGYMSPQDRSFDGHGFSCARCDWIEKGYPGMPLPAEFKALLGQCVQPQVQSTVELEGCCNLYTYKGIHT